MSGGGDDFPEEHEEHVNHEAWVIPYADLLTLLMAMFIALFATSTVDTSKFKALALGFNEALGGGKLDAGIGGSGKATSPVIGSGQGQGPFGGSTLMPADTSVDSNQLAKILAAVNSTKSAAKAQRQTLQDLKKQIDAAATNAGLGGKVRTKELNNGLQVTLLTDQVLFDSGQAALKPQGFALLSVIETLLQKIDNPILIYGYTDSVKIHSALYPNNLFLSSARADSVAQYFIDRGFDPDRLSPAGRGELHPIGDNATVAGRALNRRVEIIVQSKIVKQTLDQAGINDKVATTPPTTAAAQPAANPSVDGARPNLSPGLGAG